MPVSRLRLRLGVGFTLAYLAGLVVLDLGLYGYLRVQADQRLTRDLTLLARALQLAVRNEHRELPAEGLATAGREALREWPAPPGAYLILGPAGEVLAQRGSPSWTAIATTAPMSQALWNGQVSEEEPVRRLVLWAPGEPRFGVAVLGSALRTEEENEWLAWWLGGSLPLVLLLGLSGGYVLSRRALQPLAELQEAIAEISPRDLSHRLVVATPADEVDRVKQGFNELLDRLDSAERANRRFLRQAAHQIRTPLTLVLGEATLALREAGAGPEPVLRRIRLAAEQMQRRVEELFLLAEARAGSAPRVDATVDLEELMLEVAEAMRGRARQLGSPLRFRTMGQMLVPGNRALLREAAIELVENALRHGSAGEVVELGLAVEGAGVCVGSAGPVFELPPAGADPLAEGGEHGLGLAIVRWVAALHGGTLEVARRDGRNELTLSLPGSTGERPQGTLRS